jgi:hypothetical protein
LIKSLKLPELQDAIQLLIEAEKQNPGHWVQHSMYVAKAAELIAAHHPSLDPTTAYIFGCLHDIGRREGVTDLRHTLDGYNYLVNKGFDDAARICLTHSFPIKNIYAGTGILDCSQAELEFLKDFLAKIDFTDYDRLLQLCDSLALPTGFCLIEKRLVDVALRRGVNDLTIDKWKAFFTIKEEFEQVIGQSIYRLLPGVVGNTFGLNLTDE